MYVCVSLCMWGRGCVGVCVSVCSSQKDVWNLNHSSPHLFETKYLSQPWSLSMQLLVLFCLFQGCPDSHFRGCDFSCLTLQTRLMWVLGIQTLVFLLAWYMPLNREACLQSWIAFKAFLHYGTNCHEF